MTFEFLITTLVVVVTPGTGVIYTVGAGLSRGARASLVAAVGCTLGIVPHMLAAITGLAAVMQASAVLFNAMKLAGVAYLLYLAWTTWRDGRALQPVGDASPQSARTVIASAILINLLNPKLTLFFFAFLPQFVTGRPDSLARMIELSLVFMLVTLGVFALYGVFAAAVRDRVLALRSSNPGSATNR
jgi:threonine/homoserine/homoserine lactone efflux protein